MSDCIGVLELAGPPSSAMDGELVVLVTTGILDGDDVASGLSLGVADGTGVSFGCTRGTLVVSDEEGMDEPVEFPSSRRG